MDDLEIKRLEMQILKALAAKAELEFKKAERLRDITRIEDHIKLQEKTEKELTAKLKELKSTK
jgi:predicted phage-related endonuclease